MRGGGTIEYDYGHELNEVIKKDGISIEIVHSDELNYKKLLAGRIDILPNDPVVGYAQMQSYLTLGETQRITHHPKEFEKTTLNLIISRNCINGELFRIKFNSGLKKLKASGRYDEMIEDNKAGKYNKPQKKILSRQG